MASNRGRIPFVSADGSPPFRVSPDAVVTPFPDAQIVMRPLRKKLPPEFWRGAGMFKFPVGDYDYDDHMEC